jgi:hypothetical protein
MNQPKEIPPSPLKITIKAISLPDGLEISLGGLNTSNSNVLIPSFLVDERSTVVRFVLTHLKQKKKMPYIGILARHKEPTLEDGSLICIKPGESILKKMRIENDYAFDVKPTHYSIRFEAIAFDPTTSGFYLMKSNETEFVYPK